MNIPQFRTAGAASAAAVVLAGLAAAPAQATEGYFQHGYGAISKAIGGTGAAYSQDAMSQALNPAGLVGIDNQFNADISFFSPHREFEGENGVGSGFVPNQQEQSDNELFLIPSFAASYQVDDLSAVGVALYGNGGLNTNYDNINRSAGCPPGGSGVFCGGTAGVDLTQIFLQFTYAREIPQFEIPGVLERFTIGAGPILAAQRFEAKGLSGFDNPVFSSSPGDVTDNGRDYSYGIGGRFGIQAELPANFQLGAAYQMRTYMTEFSKYEGLFAEDGDFDVPPALQVGLSWNPVPDLTLLFDYRRIWFSEVDSVGNRFSNPALGGAQLGDNDGPGFGWGNTDIYKVGAQWEADDQWTLRAGYSYTDQPIQDTEVLLNILAPAVIEHHFTAGVEYKINDSHTIQLGGMFAPESDESGDNPFDPAQDIELRMYQYEVTLGYAWRF